MQSQIFKASLDKTTLWISTILVLFLLMVSANLLWEGRLAPGAIMLGINLIILILAFGWSPHRYQLNEQGLTMLQRLHKKNIPWGEMASANGIDPQELKYSWRIMGSWGLFGYYGRFANKKLGSMKWYLTKRDGIICIETLDQGKILVSPDDPEGFLKEFNRLKVLHP